MRTSRAKWLLALRGSVWMLPTVMLAVASATAMLLAHSQSWIPAQWAQAWPHLFAPGGQGTRTMLSAIASATITVAGVVFSVTIVALSLGATQYSPRVLRSFLRDRPTRWVLGTFVGTFTYCVIVLRTADGSGSSSEVPAPAALLAIAYAITSVVLFVYFIHHLAQSIQASYMVARIYTETEQALTRLYPQDIGSSPRELEAARASLPRQWTPVYADGPGYVVAVDGLDLLHLAVESSRVIRVRAPGDFVRRGGVLAEFAGDAPVPPVQQARVHRAIAVGQQRTVHQDPAFGIQQLVDMAVKALSPGINDPTTACLCIDRITALLTPLVRREVPSPLREAGGLVRLVALCPTPREYVQVAYAPIVQHSRGDLQVVERLANGIDKLIASMTHHDAAPALARSVRDARRQLERALADPRPADGLRRRLRRQERQLRALARRRCL